MPVNIYEAIEDGHRTKNDLWLKYFKSKLRQSETPKMPWNMSVCRLETIKLNCNGFAIGEVEMKGEKKNAHPFYMKKFFLKSLKKKNRLARKDCILKYWSSISHHTQLQCAPLRCLRILTRDTWLTQCFLCHWGNGCTILGKEWLHMQSLGLKLLCCIPKKTVL